MSESTSPPMGNPLSDSPGDEEEGPIVVQVDEQFESEIDKTDIISAVAAALDAEEQTGEVTVVVTTDEAVAGLNKQYRDADGPTDVLSFPAQNPTPGFVAAPEMDAYLGDIIIALPYTRQQAERAGKSLKDELRLLAIHGTLHLLGYDHAEPEEEAEMWAKQDAILANIP